MNARSLLAKDSNWSNFRVGFAIFLVAFVVRFGLMLVLHPYSQTLRVEIQHLAHSVARGSGYANPYPTPTGPTALYSPGCPLILASIYRAFGYGSTGEAISCLLNVATASTVFALMPLLSIRLGMQRHAGVIAASFGALVPVYLLNEFHSTTAVFGALCLIGLTLLTAWAWRGQKTLSSRLGILFGLAWGVALLISPNLLLIGLLWLLAALVHFRVKALAFSIVVLAVCFAILLPWAIRNELVLGSPIFSRSNLGLELWIANNDVAAATYGDNNESHNRYQPFLNSHEAEQLARMGEVSYMHERMTWATNWIDQHPRRFAELTASRVFHFWFPVTFRLIQTLVIGGLSLAGLVGLAYAFVRRRPAFLIVGAIWLVYPAVYYFVQLDNPYRYPIYWSILLFAVYGCMCVIDALRKLQPAAAHQTVNRQPVGTGK